MQTKRKILSILLTLCMVFVMVPTTAFAVEDYGINVSNVRITDENADDVLNDGTVSYDAETNTLTLKDVTITGDFSGSAAIQSSKENLTIMLEGENTINSGYYGILSTTGTLTFKGEGTLTLSAKKDAVRAAEINIDGITLNIQETNGSALYVSTDYDSNKGSVSIRNGANVTFDCTEFAVYADGNTGITISGSTVNSDVRNNTNVIYTWNGPLSIINSKVTVNNSAQTTFPAIWATEISISDNSEVTANISGETNAVYTPTTLTVERSSLNAESPSISVWSNGAMKIENGTVKTICTGNDVADSLHSEDTLTIGRNSDVLAIGGIWGTNGVVVSPAEGNKVDVKVGIKEDGEEGTKHLEGSPYGETITLDSYDVIGGYTYVHIKNHIHVYDQQSTDDIYKISDATCTEPAKYYQSCVCGAKGTETFENGSANGHTWSSWTSNGDDTHSRTCSECQEIEQQDCAGGEATCIAKAVCDICGDEYGEINTANHTNLVKTEAKPATATAAGNTEYWYCDGCGKYFSDESGTKEISLEDTVIPKLTEDTAGGTTDDTQKPQTDENTQTGDDSNIIPIIALMALAAAGAAAAAIYRRREE